MENNEEKKTLTKIDNNKELEIKKFLYLKLREMNLITDKAAIKHADHGKKRRRYNIFK
jgi:hypothetical protein